ncbi:regulator of ribonuclease activity A [Chitinivorax tropicus]|uniref:4-hydroxy-4-methyl-2-oxoglutarate aldolase n=1 Tax=Chitinivorax tropicus TaxID=714531 RepID=A0A840MM03_9PROT|nr:ribonuclease E activity regulator RraA [Chitinivorax tropicus]MBB5019440.1 regulator of ribonuclease activity A [Chitinivorax tropicus]
MTFQTADLTDEHANLQVATPMFQRYGKAARFQGEIVTVKVFEDNVLVKDTLSEPGQGKVLVVDGGGSLRCALVGDQIAAMAVKNGWAGIIVYGCIRDSAVINDLEIGVRALNTHPLKSVKQGAGYRQIAVAFAAVTFRPGEFVYVDEDGIVLSATALL